MFTGSVAAIGVLAVVGMLTGLSIGLKLRAAATMKHSCPTGYSKDKVDVTFFVVRSMTSKNFILIALFKNRLGVCLHAHHSV